MHDGVKRLLKIDSFAEAIGTDKDAALCLCEILYTRLSVVRRKQASDCRYFRASRQLRPQRCCYIFGCRDKPAKDDGLETIAN